MEKKQTAVEWFHEQLLTTELFDDPDSHKGFAQRFLVGVLAEQAEAMLREQIIDAQSYAISNADMTNNRGYFDCDKYYNETYGK